MFRLFIQVGVILSFRFRLFIHFYYLGHRGENESVDLFAVIRTHLSAFGITAESSYRRGQPIHLHIFGKLVHELSKIHITIRSIQETSRLNSIIYYILSILFRGLSSLVLPFLFLQKGLLVACNGLIVFLIRLCLINLVLEYILGHI